LRNTSNYISHGSWPISIDIAYLASILTYKRSITELLLVNSRSEDQVDEEFMSS